RGAARDRTGRQQRDAAAAPAGNAGHAAGAGDAADHHDHATGRTPCPRAAPGERATAVAAGLETAAMNPLTPTREPAPSFAQWLDAMHIDVILLVLILCIGALGLTVLYSASGHSMEMVVSQAQRLAFGLVVMAFAAQAPPELYRAAAPWFYGFATLLLV